MIYSRIEKKTDAKESNICTCVIDPACQNINTELQCYVLDRNCTAQSNTEASPGQDYVIYIVVILGSVLLFIVCFIVIKKCYKRWKTMRKKSKFNKMQGL